MITKQILFICVSVDGLLVKETDFTFIFCVDSMWQMEMTFWISNGLD